MMEYMQDYGVDANTTDVAFHEHEQAAITARNMLISTGQMSRLVPIGQTGTAWSVLTGVLYSIGHSKIMAR